MEISTSRCVITALIMFCGLVAGCQSNFIDQTEQMQAGAVRIEAGGVNNSLVWLDENLLAFMQENEETRIKWDYYLSVAHIGTDDQYRVPLPDHPERCEERDLVTVRDLKRLPNGNLGFRLRCSSLSKGFRNKLYMWDKASNELRLLFDYLDDDHSSLPPVTYTFSPDMTEFMYGKSERITGEIYHIGKDGQIREILSDFIRTNDPNWSPDGKTIAFMGTKTYPRVHPDEFTQYEEIRELLLYPWDIYLMDADASNVRLVLASIYDLREMQWVPLSNRYLSFTGDYDDVSGIWIFDVETDQLTRIWDTWSSYSWSKDGKQIIILMKDETKSRDEQIYPVVIDSPIQDE